MTSGKTTAVVIALLAAVAGFIVLLLVLGVSASRLLTGDPGRADAPRQIAQAPPAAAGHQESADEGWLADTSERLDIPQRVLQAYVEAADWAADEHPACGLSWNTLAGIGQIESHHGTINGAIIGEDGRVVGEIIGPALDGSGDFALIEDTDGGRMDGDTEYDRAVGPMQFLPETFTRFAVDGNGDGVSDPNQIDDAVHTAAAYLCADRRDLTQDEGWQQAILSYNASYDYVAKVYREATWIAESV